MTADQGPLDPWLAIAAHVAASISVLTDGKVTVWPLVPEAYDAGIKEYS